MESQDPPPPTKIHDCYSSEQSDKQLYMMERFKVLQGGVVRDGAMDT